MDYPSNVILLFLQVILQRQHQLVHDDKTVSIEDLLVHPIIDSKILNDLQNHKLTKLYTPMLCTASLRTIKTLFNDIVEAGISADDSIKVKEERLPEEVNLVALANYYYGKRINELESIEIPALRNAISNQVSDN